MELILVASSVLWVVAVSATLYGSISLAMKLAKSDEEGGDDNVV